MPHIYNYKSLGFSSAYDVLHVGPLIALMFSTWQHDVTVKVLPAFIPNDFLFETHKDKGEERWEIFAWAVRDAMSKAGNLPLSEQPLREKLKYMEELGSLQKWT